ncbi:UDP-N-acetylglucosamine transferase subunit ALG14-like protein [Dinothrombium tinctorium]|uniref:UDP-N-acetylglucosamine transferase subunit ALG14 n=1 Tax=Dinothrombium tinctorium TaxID=1965070 RepID=A0A443QQC5_9ACAR|nr:UDP-N-acetylglucosamine transferase subunit ALG14-like protein [Dinothrombium tinctorium]
MVILGSGGHTKEMLDLCAHLDFENKFKPLVFVIAKHDHLSSRKVQNFAEFKNSKVLFVFRSRKVGQSYFSSIFTTLWATLEALLVCAKERPQLLLCNGPGTCIPFCVAARLTSFHCTQVFVESFCRTRSLSLSAKIALFISDYVLVQWPHLAKKYPKCIYEGLLV